MSTTHTVLKFLRKIHLYLGVFLAPAIFFFALTGALQTFSLHETTQGSSYKPPAWIATLAQLHKKQTIVIPVRKQRSPADSPSPSEKAGGGHHADPASAPALSATPVPQKSHLPMKIFFLLVAFGLITSTLTGLYMSWKFQRNKALIVFLFVAGIVIPLLLLPF